jgi:hypothetical protein
MKRLTDNDLDALEAALAKATPGEWEATTYSNYAGWAVYAPGAGCIAERWYSTGQQDEIPRNDLFIAIAHNALPALLAEVRDLRRPTTPEPIGEKHRDGGPWQVWEPFYERWVYAKWREQSEMWRRLDGGDVIGTPTHALPMPPAPEPPAPRGE